MHRTTFDRPGSHGEIEHEALDNRVSPNFTSACTLSVRLDQRWPCSQAVDKSMCARQQCCSAVHGLLDTLPVYEIHSDCSLPLGGRLSQPGKRA